MSFMQKVMDGLRRFMTGRRGPDELSMALLIGGLVLTILSNLFNLIPLYFVGMAGYVLALLRTFSRDLTKRYAENAKFLSLWRKVTVSVKQFFNRLKNIRRYKYYRCPNCRSWLRLPRKVGEVTVTCGKCGHVFKQKA